MTDEQLYDELQQFVDRRPDDLTEGSASRAAARSASC